VGYTGGTTLGPTYHNLGDHTETLQVDFDPTVLSYRDLLEMFWRSHDPTRRAWSAQYKAAVFVASAEQERAAQESRDRLAGATKKTIRTEILPAGRFTVAEDYHQKYYLRSDRTLMADFRAMFGEDQAVFRESTAAARINGYVAGDGTRAQLSREIDLLGLGESGRARLLEKVGDGNFGGVCSIGSRQP
jgi:peptide-methionine (S)-S-oxide reductase